MREFMAGMLIMFGLCVFGYTVSIKEDFISKNELHQRGHMVECIGKAGYYWECE